jgi:hypothetical protein
MTATITEAREGIAAALRTIPGLRAHAIAPDNIACPAAVVEPDTAIFLTYDVAMARGADDLILRITLFVNRASERAGQAKLDAYIAGDGPQSVRAAVEADPTLGGLVDSVAVTTVWNYGQVTFGGVDYFGCQMVVEVAL